MEHVTSILKDYAGPSYFSDGDSCSIQGACPAGSTCTDGVGEATCSCNTATEIQQADSTCIGE